MTMHHQATRHRHGFATFTAVVMISLVGTALLALTLLLQTDARRSMRHGTETQLRQLLIAGGTFAQIDVNQETDLTDTRTLQLPADLEAGQVNVTYLYLFTGTIEATVTARFEEYKAVQILSLVSTDSGWVLKEAQLTRQH